MVLGSAGSCARRGDYNRAAAMCIRNGRIIATFLLATGLLAGPAVGQAAAQPGCNPTITPSQQAIPTGGGTGRINVVLPPGCAWTAASSDTSWLTITSGASGTGTGLVTYQG